MTHFENYILIKELCLDVVRNRKTEDILKLGDVIREKKSWGLLQNLQNDLLATLYVVLKNEAQKSSDLTNDEKIIVIEILDTLLTHINLSKETVFFNLYGFLLLEIYDGNLHEVKSIPEEYKLAVLSCTKSLLNCTTSELTETLYTKENGNRLCKMIYVAVKIATIEKFQSLRIVAIECLMASFKVHLDSDYADLLFRSLVAKSFSFFLPGVSLCLRNVALGDEKVGFKLIKISIKAMGRIVSLLMQDYEESFQISSLQQAKSMALNCMKRNERPELIKEKKNKFEDYMEGVRNFEWFQKADGNLAKLFSGYRKLTQHPILQVRKELAEMCCLIIDKCLVTCPVSCRYLVEILIILSEDEEQEIREISNSGLKELILNLNNFVEHQIQDGFLETYTEIPAIFNGIDEKQKIAVLRLVTGYINLLQQNLQYHNYFREFMHILLHLCQFEVDISTFDGNVQDLENEDFSEPHESKNFKFLGDECVRKEFTNLCHSLVRNQHFEILLDFLLTAFQEIEERKEATYFLNELISGLKNVNCDKSALLKPIFSLYIKPENWNLLLKLCNLNGGLSLRDVRNNIQQAALYVDGIGIIAEVLGNEFRPFLMHCLFLVLTRAGSEQRIVQISGRKALKNVANALKYPNIPSLVHDNMDYIALYIEKNLRHNAENEVINVMEVLFKYGNRETLDSILIVMEEVLDRSIDKFHEGKIDLYLSIFKSFIKSQQRLFDIRIPTPIFKTKSQKKNEELQNFQVTGLDTEIMDDFSDDIMKKSAEELYKEDLEKSRVNDLNEEPQVEDYKKPKPPKYIEITVGILKSSLNFLPSKRENRKLLVLEILKDGLEIIKDFEDDLLPVVHLIWSPLVSRFKESNPVIINYSFQLLTTLARVSKDFIRNRTSKDVFPSILDILTKLSKESFMKDKGSAYRYTQSYKLQVMVLENLGYLLCDIDFSQKDVEETMDVVFLYLNSKQPIPLQHAALNFFKLLVKYEPEHKNIIEKWSQNEDFGKNINNILQEIE